MAVSFIGLFDGKNLRQHFSTIRHQKLTVCPNLPPPSNIDSQLLIFSTA